jgi:hypothetical protein
MELKPPQELSARYRKHYRAFRMENCPQVEAVAVMVKDTDMVMVTARTALNPNNLIQYRSRN